ncbi:MAG: A/G-specific adenine glycosylase [Flavobacteriales bacterium]|nr:A/G-specific adenine glycosylase [Flavobacteriales bacterium]
MVKKYKTPHISAVLQQWYIQNKRDLPWRGTKDAYTIWLSEIILQQTRVEQGMPYFTKFLETYPSVLQFANADIDDLLKNWQGLGYYSRCRNMHKCAATVRDCHNGIFPTEYEVLIKLPGIGDYTASAISSFAKNHPNAVIDGNVFRFLSRYFGIEEPINSTASLKIFKSLAEEILDKDNAATHNQSIMEFGALQCRPANPNCALCPLTETCMANRTNMVSKFPVKLSAKPKKKRFLAYLVFETPHQSTIIQQRTKKDVWQGLYEFPLLESEKKLPFTSIFDHLKSIYDLQNFELQKDLETKHILSHQEIYAQFWNVKVASFKNLQISDTFEVDFNELKQKYAVSVLIEKYLKSFKNL